MRRLMAAVLSTILFALLFAWIYYVPLEDRSPNVYYFGLMETFLFVAVYAGPIYLLAGIPSSILIDKLVKPSQNFSYLIKLVLYASFSIIIGLIFILVFNETTIIWSEIYLFLVYCMLASMLYFHVFLLMSKYKG